MKNNTYIKPEISTVNFDSEEIAQLIIQSGIADTYRGIEEHRRGCWGDLWSLTETENE